MIKKKIPLSELNPLIICWKAYWKLVKSKKNDYEIKCELKICYDGSSILVLMITITHGSLWIPYPLVYTWESVLETLRQLSF